MLSLTSLTLTEMLKFVCATFFIIAFVGLQQAEGHGILLDPVSRGSRWRVDGSKPRNYNDNELFCGGLFVSWSCIFGNCLENT